jgi:hypothetical protein
VPRSLHEHFHVARCMLLSVCDAESGVYVCINTRTCTQVREKEADIDTYIAPIEDMYSLLLRYEVRVPKEETGMVSDLRYGWKKLRKLAADTSDNLARLQVRTCNTQGLNSVPMPVVNLHFAPL